MKKILLLALFLGLFSCTQDNISTEETHRANSGNNGHAFTPDPSQDFQTYGTDDEPEEPTFYIYYSDYDEWGHASADCKGWGLCNFRDCWFCCLNSDDEIVPCDDEEEQEFVPQHPHPIKINPATGKGYLVIELDPTKPDEYNAITNQLTLYVDNDLYSDLFKLDAGAYTYDSLIGDNGGYEVPATKIH